MKAQTAKNAVIVPVGAKGGFVVKRALGMAPTRCVRRCRRYRASSAACSTSPTTSSTGRSCRPAGSSGYDGDDPYLVVAADKGTATFSDVANELAAEYGYWLGDAFASGGSTGYDHKEMGITSRGAWISVRTHFRRSGIDADTAELTVVGIGDMSGDVFGNGMLRSPHLQARRRVRPPPRVLRPDPDPAASASRERQRLFALPSARRGPTTTPSLISPGGGVLPARRQGDRALARGTRGARRSPTPRALDPGGGHLGDPVRTRRPALERRDRHVREGEPRVERRRSATGPTTRCGSTPTELRCRVVAEGGNLGLTQAARVEYALGGGRVYTDAIDNSAGVDCSDHEVNIKILLREADRGRRARGGGARRRSSPSSPTRSRRWCSPTTRRRRTRSRSRRSRPSRCSSVHARQIERLERAGILDRRLEGLPDAKQLQERTASGRGLTAPELAVLLAFTKLDLQRQLVASDVPDDAALERELLAYFPTPLREPFADAARRHRAPA